MINLIHNHMHLSKNRSAQLVESLLEITKKTLENGENIMISGFGKFSVRDNKKGRGRIPQLGQDLLLAEMRVVTFKCSPVLEGKLNGKRR